MPLFRPEDLPKEVMQKVIGHAEAGYEGLIKKEGTMALNKLRYVGVYDDRQEGYFMLRTRIPGGRLTTEQARVIGEVAVKFSRRPRKYATIEEKFLEITTRQDIQLHWIQIQDLPKVWEMYNKVGLTTFHSCGNVARNVVCCPVSGVGEGEVIDAYPLVEEITEFLLENPEYGAVLPRKFKVAISGSKENCILAQIHDLSFTPAIKDGEVGFNVLVGGGLSDYPRIASPLGLFVFPSEVLETVLAGIKLFKDLGDYKHTAVNRFRLLVKSMGVGRVREEMQKRAAFDFRAAGESLVKPDRVNHLGVHRQKQQGLVYVGLGVPVGRMRGEELIELAKVVEEYNAKELRTTIGQNLVVLNIREGDLKDFLEEPILNRFPPNPRPFFRNLVACTSAPLCKFGILEAKPFALSLAKHLDQEVYEKHGWDGEPITIHISGCKSSCAQPQIADIGLRASVAKGEAALEEAFDVGFGGNISEGRFIEWVEMALPIHETYGALERILKHYLSKRQDGEAFGVFCRRLGKEGLHKIIQKKTMKVEKGE